MKINFLTLGKQGAYNIYFNEKTDIIHDVNAFDDDAMTVIYEPSFKLIGNIDERFYSTNTIARYNSNLPFKYIARSDLIDTIEQGDAPNVNCILPIIAIRNFCTIKDYFHANPLADFAELINEYMHVNSYSFANFNFFDIVNFIPMHNERYRQLGAISERANPVHRKKKNKLIIGFCSDHAGLRTKNAFKEVFAEHFGVVDFGTYTTNACKYSDYMHDACDAQSRGEIDVIFGFCYTAQGMNITANKFSNNIISALVYNSESMEMAILHSSANCFCFPEMLFYDSDLIKQYCNILLNNIFEGGRHAERLCCAVKIT